jgi:hypothetical protein
MSTDSITYLTGAGMVEDLLTGLGVVLFMAAISFGLGIGMALIQKRKALKEQRAAVAMKIWQRLVAMELNTPTAPACGVAQSCNACSTCPDLHNETPTPP